MIYTVECSFADPAGEAEWNDFYSHEKLPALISVTGFHTSQRFRAITEGCPVYLAVHTIDGLDVLTGEEYRRKGGGNFARWQQHITDWHRNLYSDIGLAPAVGADELLVLCSSGPDRLVEMGLAPLAMQAIALEKNPERRWLAVSSRSNARLVGHAINGIHLYTPITARLTSASAT
ncbi:sugar ABC transporter [Pandoraea apista]|uniref:Sugar ABC transporter n=1 Tax=Pandoraea apista TaxID=93218 RepID=A0ABX9ZRU4_9BURK|nr:sugar ABC transporter [Pandoraea apista]PTE00427.1 sugar ABC transporter [Pandoraea apista]RRJ28453.1 sugar ABC transporter [Pandoraea apista]RRJ74176.1 sugar ABC transporter [Pandoraea apista]RSD12672.1 sugar ABC transporter [Pandoraea apista]RSD18645.1 sugar ABC transporter [Pandoraea apista]